MACRLPSEAHAAHQLSSTARANCVRRSRAIAAALLLPPMPALRPEVPAAVAHRNDAPRPRDWMAPSPALSYVIRGGGATCASVRAAMRPGCRPGCRLLCRGQLLAQLVTLNL